MRRTGLAVAIVVVALSMFALGGCGGNSSGGDAEGASTVKRPSAKPPVYHLAEYDMETGWTNETLDEKVGSYLQSVWHDPASFSSKLIIDSRPAAGAPPPMAGAELARVQANWLPKYQERSLKRVKLGRRSMIRLVYFAAGEDRIEYFFEECGTSIIFRGSTTPIAFEPFSRFYGIVASRVKAVCAE
jgi:hypothetical protein